MKVRSDNYITIQGWMVTDLKLKGLDLLVYAIIYGFSQCEGHFFNGSLSYLMEWTNSSKNGVMKSLNNLLFNGLIKKQQSTPTNIYYAVSDGALSVPVNKKDGAQSRRSQCTQCTTTVHSVDQDGALSGPNTIDNTNYNKDYNTSCEQVLDYLNEKCGTNYRVNPTNKKLIAEKLDEGFTVEDMKTVVDTKYEDWGRNPKPFSNGQLSSTFLRPATLFGKNFKQYLAQHRPTPASNSVSAPVLDERTGELF